MKTYVPLIGMLALLVVTAIAPAKDPDPAVKKTFDKLIGAIQANDRDAFVADATDAVKDVFMAKLMDTINKQVGTRFKDGHQAAYLCELRQMGRQVHLWKVTFKDKGDDMVVRIALMDGKVDGFFLQ